MANDCVVGQQVDLPLVVDIDSEEEYEVLGDEDRRWYHNHLKYHIHWTGYESVSWEPAIFVDVHQVVEEFRE